MTQRADVLKKALLLLNLLFLFILMISLGLIQKDNNDIWWHLKTGQLLLENHVFPRTDIYSYTAAGRPWVLHEWLSQVIFYKAYTLGGESLLALLRPICLILVFFILMANIFLDEKGFAFPEFLLFIFLTYIGVMAIWPRIIVRPHLLSMVMMVLFFYCLTRYRLRRDRSLYYLPPLQVLWVNLHSAAILGIILVIMFFAGCWLDVVTVSGKKVVRQEPTKNDSGRIFLIVVLVILATFANPSTYHIFGELETMKKEYLGIKEWQSPFSVSPYMVPNMFFYWFYPVLAIIFATMSFRKISWSDIIICVFLAIISLKSLRNIEIFVLVTIPIVYRWGRQILQNLERRTSHMMVYYLTGGGLAVIVCLTSIKVTTQGMHIVRSGRNLRMHLGVGYNKPDGAIDYVLKNHLRGNMYNSYDIGGYIIWRGYPDLKVMMDGRVVVYGKELLWKIMYLDPEKLESLVREYSIGYFILKNSAGEEDLNDYLHLTKRWALVYFDDEALVYVKRDAAYENLIRHDEFKYLNPVLFEVPKSSGGMKSIPELLPEYVREAKQAISLHPQDLAGYVLAGYIYFRTGQFEKSVTYYEKAMKIKPDLFVDYTPLGYSYMMLGEKKKAGKFFKMALRHNPSDAFARRCLNGL